MSTKEHDRLLAQLRDWCRQDRGRQRLIAKELRISPQLVSAWITGVRTMSLDEWFQVESIIETHSGSTQFLKDKPMSTPRVFDPAKLWTSARIDPDEQFDCLTDEPRTLGRAIEMLDELRAQFRQLKMSSTATLPPPAAASAPPTLLTTAKGPVEIVVPIMAPKKADSGSTTTAPTPATHLTKDGVVRAYDDTEIGKLLTKLNAAKDPGEINEIYRQTKALRAKR